MEGADAAEGRPRSEATAAERQRRCRERRQRGSVMVRLEVANDALDALISLMRRLPLWRRSSTTTLWHLGGRGGGRPPHQVGLDNARALPTCPQQQQINVA
jgi:hypothetical protein